MAKKSTGKEVSLTSGKIGSYKMDASAFDQLTGEKALGLNILDIAIGEAAGPFVLVNILKDQDWPPVLLKSYRPFCRERCRRRSRPCTSSGPA